MEKEEIEKLRKKLLEQVEKLPEEQASALREQIKSASPEQIENFIKKQKAQSRECFFCQFVSGKIETDRIYEDSDILAVLDIYPVNLGQMIVIPKKHFQYMHEIPDALLNKIFIFVKTIEPVLLEIIKAQALSIYIAQGPAAGQTVNHFSVNIIPRFEGDGARFDWERKKPSKEDLGKMAEKIREKAEKIVREKLEAEKKKIEAKAKAKEAKEAEKIFKHIKPRIP